MTRFNIGLYNKNYWSKDKNGIDIDPKSWLEHRFKLFDKYCIPSICHQNNKNFIWLVLFDKDTPKEWFDKIWSYKNICSNYVPIFVNNNGHQWSFGGKEIKSYMFDQASKSGHTHIITTRFDNDDGLSNDAIESIQNNIIDKDILFINMMNGYLYDICNKRFYQASIHSNSFITAIEKVSLVKTIFGWGSHSKLQYNHPEKIINIYTGNWLQIIHDRNMVNKNRGNNINHQIPNNFFFSNHSWNTFLHNYNID